MDQQFEILLITRKNVLNSIKDLSIEALTKIPKGFNNNIIWNAAHNLATQQLLVYKLSGQSPVIPGELIDKYRKGTSAPAFNAISAYSLESVETITLSIFFDFKQASIDQLITGFPPRSLIFLSLTPLDPDLAGIRANTSFIGYLF